MRRKTPLREPSNKPDHREFVSGFIRLHILYHAVQEPLVGFRMIEELRRHGYEMSPGTIYPLLHSLQKKGYLSVEVKREGKRAWREYSATKEGKKVLTAAKRKGKSFVVVFWSRDPDGTGQQRRFGQNIRTHFEAGASCTWPPRRSHSERSVEGRT